MAKVKRDDLKEYLRAPEDLIVPQAKTAADWANSGLGIFSGGELLPNRTTGWTTCS